jgi:hypothetical protein
LIHANKSWGKVQVCARGKLLPADLAAGGSAYRLQLLVAAVAGHAVAAVFAAAKIDGFRFLGLEFLRRKLATLVGAVAERLGCALATGAEPVALAFLNFDSIGAFLGNDGIGLGHGFSFDEVRLGKYECRLRRF